MPPNTNALSNALLLLPMKAVAAEVFVVPSTRIRGASFFAKSAEAVSASIPLASAVPFATPTEEPSKSPSSISFCATATEVS